MKPTSLGTIVAERRLRLVDKPPVVISIGKPEPFPDSNGYYCPYRILGLSDGQIRHAGGEDAVQALLLALKRVGADLYTSAEAKAGLLTWEAGSSKSDLGFPVPDSIRDLAPP